MPSKKDPARPSEDQATLSQPDPAAAENTGVALAEPPSQQTPSLAIMDIARTDYRKFAALQGTPQRQGMRGFNPDYVDIVDYIVRVTHRIWEEKNVGLLYQY